MTVGHQAADAAQPAHRLLDIAGGLGRVMGDRALYQRMLARFRDDYAGGAAPLRRAIAGGDLPLAHRLAHTLKGSAGMIGAPAVQRHAALIEAALNNADIPRGDDIDILDGALGAVTRAIGHLVAAPQPAAGPSAARAPAGAQLVAQLAHLLDQGDAAALDLLEQSHGSLEGALGVAGFEAVARAAREFDFEGARAALRRAERSIGWISG